MDIELFQFDDDDELLSNAYIEATQQLHHASESCLELNNVAAPEFQCAGEDTNKSEFATESFMKKGFIKSLSKICYSSSSIARDLQLSVGGFVPNELYARAVTQLVFAESCKNIQNLVMNARGIRMVLAPISCEDNKHYQHRCQVTNLYHILLRTMHATNWPQIQPHLTRLRQLINNVLDADTWKLIYFANSPKGNESKLATYHLLHGALEWRLLDLCILQKYELMSNDTITGQYNLLSSVAGNNSTTFYTQLTRIFNDILLCASYHYSKKRTIDLLYSTPFGCTCIKEFWLILQQLIAQCLNITAKDDDDGSDDSLEFRSIFNKAMNGFLKEKLLTQLEYTQFANWLINALARLHTLNKYGVASAELINTTSKRYVPENAENYELLCNCTQQFLNANPHEEQLRVYICLMIPVLMEYWRPRIDIVILLWEYFHKRLNSSFFISGSAPSNLAVACGSGRAYLERCRNLLAKEQPDVNLSSYTLHVLLLGKTIQQFEYGSAALNCNSNQTKKLIGRINSKFSLQKFLTLNETGIHHLIELFLILSLSDNLNLLMPTMRDQMLTLEFKLLTGNKQLAIAKGHMAMLILHAQNQLALSPYITKLLAQLECINNDPIVCRIFADGLLDIFTLTELNDDQYSDVDVDEHLFIDKWLSNFLVRSKPIEQERTLEALHLIFVKYGKRLMQSDGTSNVDSTKNKVLMKTLNTHILPFLRLQFNNNNSIWMPQLAADFCLYAADKRTFDMLCNYFCVSTQPLNQTAQPQIMLKLMQSTHHIGLLDQSIILQVWLKSLVLLTGQHKLVMELTKNIIEIPEFKFMITSSSSSSISTDDLLKPESEPLHTFIAAVGKHYNDCTDSNQRLKIADKFNGYLQNFEKWPEVNGKLDLSEVPMRFYSFIATVLYNCASLVYVKAKPNCFFHLAITRFILPQNIQMGQAPAIKLAQIIHKIWLVIVQGIGRLNFKSDKYINKTLNDLIEKWVPNFKIISTNPKIVARPFIACIRSDNKELSLYIFDRLTSSFLNVSKRLMNPNACIVIAIFQEVINDIITNDDSDQHLLTFMKATSLLTLEHIINVDMKSPSYEMIVTIFKTILLSRLFQNSQDLNELLLEHLRLVTQKHMPYITFFCFQLHMKLVEIYPPIITKFMDFLRTEVSVIEEKRGGTEDYQLRGFLHKLEVSLEKHLSLWKKNEINRI